MINTNVTMGTFISNMAAQWTIHFREFLFFVPTFDTKMTECLCSVQMVERSFFAISDLLQGAKFILLYFIWRLGG